MFGQGKRETMKHKRVIAWVNRIRREHFGKGPIKRLPRGEINSECSCPIHNSFWKPGKGGYVYGDRMNFPVFEMDVSLPIFVQTFIEDFDSGKYPELVK